MKHRLYLIIIGILIVALLLRDGCECSGDKPATVVKVDTVTLIRTDTVTQDRPVPYAVKVPAGIIYRDTGRVVIDSFGILIVPDSASDAIISDYFSAKYYDTTFTGDGWVVRKWDTLFQNAIYNSNLEVSVQKQIITKTVQQPPRRELYGGLTGAFWPGSFSAGPQLAYKDKRGRIFTGSVMAGQNGLIYQAGIGFKLSFTKK